MDVPAIPKIFNSPLCISRSQDTRSFIPHLTNKHISTSLPLPLPLPLLQPNLIHLSIMAATSHRHQNKKPFQPPPNHITNYFSTTEQSSFPRSNTTAQLKEIAP